MLKKLTIRNFKAIQDMTIEFTPLTVLIGENAAGKSTVLQAIDFLRSAASRDIPEYLREKGWNFEDLKSKLYDGQSKPIEFVSIFEFSNNKMIEMLIWTINIDCDKNNWKIEEKIENLTKNELLYPPAFALNGPLMAGCPDAYAGSPTAFAREFNFHASCLKYFAYVDKIPLLSALKNYLLSSINFELLSPDKMRSGRKLPYSHYIGAGGEALANFIHTMSDQEKSQLNAIVSDLFGSTIEIQTHDQGSRVEITAVFKSSENTITVDSMHISDGLLRMLALAAITLASKKQSSTEKDTEYVAEPDEAYSEKNGFPCKGIFLLDEIEDGINPYLSEQLLLLLRKIVEIEKKQVIVTTHSPVMLNDFLPEEIVFLWRDKNGFTHSRKLFDTKEMQSFLYALNPGEVWINLEKEDILDKLSTDKEGRE